MIPADHTRTMMPGAPTGNADIVAIRKRATVRGPHAAGVGGAEPGAERL
jgi:hypothetical protein